MISQRLSGTQLLLLLLDVTLINLSYLLILFYRAGFNIYNYNFAEYLQIAPWVSFISILLFYAFDLYSGWENKNFFSIFYSLVLAVVSSTALISGVTYLTQSYAIPRLVMVLTTVVGIVFMGAVRIVAWAIYKHLHEGKRILIVVNNYSEIMTLTEKLLKYRQGWGYVYDYLENPSVEDFEKKAEDADVVVITDKAGNREYILDYCVKTQKEILMVPDMFGIILYSAEPQFVDDLLMFAMRPPGLKPYQVLTKRGFDICISLTVLIILSPVMLLVACLINVTSSGGIIFKQERLGLGGKPFKVFKFRTMVANAEEATGPVLATENDPRVTKLGSFLRASRLDELPQLFNVLSGDMSIVGPRPEREFFVTQFSEFVPFYRYRMVVRPGVTGLAQVMGRYTTSAEDKLRFDLMYIRNYSLLLDFNILIQTIRVVLEWEKATGVNQRTEGKVFEKADRHLGA